MAMRAIVLAACVLVVASVSALAQDEKPRNPNSRLRRLGSPESQSQQPQEPVQSSGGVSVSASAGASAMGWGRGGGFARGSGSAMGGGSGYGVGGPNQSRSWNNGMGGGTARSFSNVTVTQDGKSKQESSRVTPNSSSSRRSKSSSSVKSGEKATRTTTLVEDDRTIVVVETKNRVKVTITNEETEEEKSYSAKDVEELKKKFPEAYDAYKLAVGENEEAGDVGGDAKARGKEMMKRQLDELEEKFGSDPNIREMIQKMRREMELSEPSQLN